ncbi:hypothetical protein DH2020_028678 [Rehmannia glutinosa]|uniref:CRAL-TRIO domain-containing protein n=1 Tax=Rehmannia glutinosa TaxID=99300 RepID=A0ABR0VRN8_REHGL
MQKPKELLKEIFISGGVGGSKQSPSPRAKHSTYNKKKTKKPFYPPIEAHWQLSPLKKRQKSNRSFKAMLSNSFKSSKSFGSLLRSQSTKMVFEGPHNARDEEVVDSFRELLFLEGVLPGNHFDYHTLLRFLRMRDFDLMKAKDMFMKYIKWREEFGVDAISKEFKYEEYEEVKKCYPHGFHGVDRYGRPVYIERIGMVDLDRFLQVTTIDRFVKHHVCEQEKTLNWRYPACSLAAKKHIASTLSILDVKDVTLHQLYIINAGSGFKVLWKAIRAFLDARTLAKIRGMLYTEEEQKDGPTNASNENSAFPGDTTRLSGDSPGRKYVDKALLQKIQAFEPVLEDAEEAHDDAINGLVAKNGIVYSSSADGKIKVWGKQEKNNVHCLQGILEGNKDISLNSVVIFKDGRLVYGGGSDGFIMG